MLGRFVYAFHIPGTLAADVNIRFALPAACHLQHVSAVASNDSDATLKVGKSTDDDAAATDAVIGDSNVPVNWDAKDGDLVNDVETHYADGDICVLTLDHDGDGGTASQNVTIALTFTEA
jgi:hypothetical protein